MLELYNNNLVDLLRSKNEAPLELHIREDEGKIRVENAKILSISNIEDLKNIIRIGNDKRHTSGTLMNKATSRSHLILSIYIESTNLKTQSVDCGKVYGIFVTWYLEIKLETTHENENVPECVI